MMKLSERVKTIILTSALVLSSFACAVSSTLAWVVANNSISMTETAGYTNGAYFARGKGTYEEPFILNAPIHLYNLSWLQYLGKFDDRIYYFEMEADIDASGTEYEKIPPIGTEEHPFTGNFDGKGHTISGLKTCNKLGSGEDEILRKPSLVGEDFAPTVMGVFGVVETFDGTVPAGEDGSIVENFNIKNYTIVSDNKDILVGVVAGYVDGELSNIKVSNEDKGISFNIADVTTSSTTYSNLSDYGLVGYTTNTTTFNEEGLTVYKPYVSQGDSSSGGAGTETLWGASATARNLHMRLNTIEADTSNQSDLVWQNNLKKKTAYYDSDGNVLDGTETNEYYTDEELALGASQWESDPLKGKAVVGSDGESFTGSIDRPAEKGWKDVKFTIGGTGGDSGGESGGGTGGGESGETGQDAIDPSDPYIAPTTDPTASYKYISVQAYGDNLSLVNDKSQARVFDRDEGFYLTYTVDSNSFTAGIWHINSMKDGQQVEINRVGSFSQVIQDRGRYIRMANPSDPSNGYPYYLRHNGTRFVLTNSSSLANVVYIDNVLRVDPNKGSTSNRIANITETYTGISHSNAIQTVPSFKEPIRNASKVAVARYYQSTNNPWNDAAQVVDNRAKAAVAHEDSNGFVYFDYSNGSLYPGYYTQPSEGEHTIANGKGMSFKFKVTSTGTLILYQGNNVYQNSSGQNCYYSCNGTTFVATYDSTKANVTLSDERIKAVIMVEPGSLGDDAWVQKTYSKTHEETLGETYLPLTIYESDDVPADDVSFWNDNSITPSSGYPTPNNSGYIVGGTKGYTYNESDGSCNYQSAYNFKTFDNSSIPFGGTTSFPIVTRTAETNGFNFVSVGGNASSLGSHITSSTVQDPNDLGFERFDNSKTALSGQSTNFMRFTGDNVTKDNYINADSVLFNKHIYNDYELPESVIDFEVENNAIFNMFASSYAGGELCTGFASFYQIFRGNITRGEGENAVSVTGGISEIRRISKIYKSQSDEALIYEYFDFEGYYKYDSSSNGYNQAAELEDGYSLSFDMAWIESPGFTTNHNACYYFEWPVSPGEYAVGSTPVAEGTEINLGYICSVGLGAPAGLTVGTEIYEKYIQTTKTYRVVEGVYFVTDVNATPKAEDSLAFSMEKGFAGTFKIVNGGEGVTILNNYDSESMELIYKKYGTIVKKSASDPPSDYLEANPVSSSKKKVERLTNIGTAANGNVITRVVTSTIIDDGAAQITGYSSLSPYTSHIDESTPTVQFYFIRSGSNEVTVTIGVTTAAENDTYVVTKINVDVECLEDIDITFVKIDEEVYDIYLNGVLVTTVNVPIVINA